MLTTCNIIQSYLYVYGSFVLSLPIVNLMTETHNVHKLDVIKSMIYSIKRIGVNYEHGTFGGCP